MITPSAPWTALYPPGVPAQLPVDDGDLVTAWCRRVAADPDAPAICYFDAVLSGGDVEEASDALAVGLAALGVARGDHVGIYLQNIPAYPVAMLALWKLGAAALILNPMYRGAELRRLIDDAAAVGIIHGDSDTEHLGSSLAGSSVRWRISTSAADVQQRSDPRALGLEEPGAPAPQGRVWELIEANRGKRPPTLPLSGDDVALLTYTSGTTGPPKGAMNTHRNVLAVVDTYGAWLEIGPDDAVLAMAPLFHITGAVVNAALAMLRGSSLVLINRFHPEVALEAFAEHRVTNTVGSITAYNAMARVPWASAEHFASARILCSGGAPIPPSTVERFEDRFGVYIHNAYGMTETTSGVIVVPPGRRAPVEPGSGTLSIGVPLPNVQARIVDADGSELSPGMQGELELSGPAVVPGYWRNPEATAATMPEGRLRTGDVAIIDDEGWVYLVDRLKDQINVSGYKVWPREVEDALYAHPGILEAAVVGRPDDYQGESVVAYVSLKDGAMATPEELVGFVRGRLAAYKVPRAVHVVDDLPKTLTGKIRRNVLREGNEGGTA